MDPKEQRPKEDENPFENLKLGDWEMLGNVSGRSLCRICNKSRKYFCYSCYIAVPELEGKIPNIKLPIKIDIIKHPGEIDGKSTAAHAAVLASDDIKISTYPFVPEYGPEERVVLVYPSKMATSIASLFDDDESDNVNVEVSEDPASSKTLPLPITRAVFIDSTWNQSKGIYKDPRLRALPCVVLKSRLSQFWRHQKGSPRWYLATVEAVHQLLVELHDASWQRHVSVTRHDSVTQHDDDPTSTHVGPYCGQYDNLLFFFRYMYSKIHTLYGHENLLSYQRRMV